MTNKFKDLFISYGRRESLGFVGRLHQRLKLAGYDGWFDKVNIPDGDDYAERISHGIESAHNFVYVMAPRCLTSPYCLLELEYARLLGKRVIPINQMVIFETLPQELSDGDKQVMVSFYKHYNQPDQNIHTTQEVLERSIALIGRTDWLAGQEKVSDEDCQRLIEWAQPYENNWAKHDDLEYLQGFEFPVFGETIDALDGVVERITTVIERQPDYVHRHTEILTDALHWQKNQKATQHLLVGKERTAAEEWLLTEFLPPKQPPCLPSALVCEFICEARKNAENRMTDVFICYDVHDIAIRDSVVQSLSRHSKTAWTHDRDIEKGASFGRVIEIGIENADNFFFFLSPLSVTSEYCQKELAHALKYNKRIVPLLIVPTPEAETPEVLRELQYVDFTDNTCQADYDSDIDDILNILRLDHEYYEQHKVLLARALKWESEERKSSFLLRGHNLENAKTWLRLNVKREQHPPLGLHKELIAASEAAKGQLGTEVFVSYSRKDADFARRLNTALQEAGKTTWFDQESISTGVDFENEIFKGIRSADNFLFVLSPDAVESEYCEREVNYASEQSKRFISVLHREVEPETMPEALRVINWIDFKDAAFDRSFPELIQAIELDREHAHQHTVLQQRAGDWAENDRSKDFLLNITACANAESWRDTAKTEAKQPTVTEVQESFIQKSRNAIKAANRMRNIAMGVITVSLIIAVFLAGFAFVQMDVAKKAKTVADNAKTEAIVQKDKAVKAQANAEAAQMEAIAQKNKAKKSEMEAKKQRDESLKTQSLFLADLAYQQLERDNAGIALSLAYEALNNPPDRPKLFEAKAVLHEALYQHRKHATLNFPKNITKFSFSYDGKYVIGLEKTESAEKAILWNANTGEKIRVLQNSEIENFTDFDPYFSHLYGVDHENKKLVFLDTDGEQSIPLPPTDNCYHFLTVSPDRKYLITDSGICAVPGGIVDLEQDFRLWEINGKEVKSITHIKERIIGSRDKGSAVFSHDGKKFITNDGEVWHVNQGECLSTLLDTGEIQSITISIGGQHIAAAFDDGIIKVWDIETGKESINPLTGYHSMIRLAFSPDSENLIIASKEGLVKQVNIETASVSTLFKESFTDILFSPNGEYALMYSEKKLKLRKIKSNQESLVLTTKVDAQSDHFPVYQFSNFSLDGRHVFMGIGLTIWQGIQVWDTSTGEEIRSIGGRVGPISPNGEFVVTCPTAMTGHPGSQLCSLVNVDTGESASLSLGPSSPMAFSSDGQYLLGSSPWKWDAKTRYNESSGEMSSKVDFLSGHIGWLDIKTDRILARVKDENILAVSPDSTFMLVKGPQGISIWPFFIDTQTLINYVRDNIPLQLTPKQRQQFFLLIKLN